MQSERVCPFKMGYVKERQQRYLERLFLATELERKEKKTQRKGQNRNVRAESPSMTGKIFKEKQGKSVTV